MAAIPPPMLWSSFIMIKRNGALTSALCLILFLVSTAMSTQAFAKVLARVNNTEITDEDLAIASEDLSAGLPQDGDEAEKRAYVLDYLIDLRLVARKAEAEKLMDTAHFKQQMDYYKQKILMETLFTSVAKQASDEGALHKIYDDAAKTQQAETEVHARHILVTTKDEAIAVIKRLKAGEDFAKLADEISKDPGSKGGDLGWFTKDKMVPEFATTAFALKPGQLSDPVQTQFGWHVIRLEEQREKQFPSFDVIKDQISRYLIQKAQAELITKLRDGAAIERLVSAPKPTANPPSAPQK
jgi:peptidyl-prolyl cis-trans isomerase C